MCVKYSHSELWSPSLRPSELKAGWMTLFQAAKQSFWFLWCLLFLAFLIIEQIFFKTPWWVYPLWKCEVSSYLDDRVPLQCFLSYLQLIQKLSPTMPPPSPTSFSPFSPSHQASPHVPSQTLIFSFSIHFTATRHKVIPLFKRYCPPFSFNLRYSIIPEGSSTFITMSPDKGLKFKVFPWCRYEEREKKEIKNGS